MLDRIKYFLFKRRFKKYSEEEAVAEVEKTIEGILKKTGFRDREELVKWAKEQCKHIENKSSILA